MFWKVLASEALVIAVFGYMWRLPPARQGWLVVSPYLALAGVWLGALAVVGSAMLWWVAVPDYLLPVVLLALDPAAIAAGALVFWTHRHTDHDLPAVNRQKSQALVAITLGVVASMMGYGFVISRFVGGTPW